MKYFKTTAVLTMVFIAASPLQAHTTDNGWFGTGYGPLGSDDPNYFVIADSFDSDGLNENTHVEFYLSIGYPILLTNSKLDVLGIDRIIPIYNGLYDFYLWGNRHESAPIISRRQNPGLVAEWDLGVTESGKTTLRFGYFHESNGQTINDEQGTGMAEFAAQMAKVDEEYALSQVSRGWDYLTARAYYTSSTNNIHFRLSAELRHHFDFQAFGTSESEEHIFWTAVAEQPRIREYDGIRLMAEQHFKLFGNDANARLELKTGIGGDQALENWSGKVSFTWGVLHIFYWNGYGKEPSTYHLRTNYAGVGLEFR